ncbi:MAG: hypothetical protein ACOC9X_02090 [bacterium]
MDIETVRGFVLSIEVGRAGLVTVRLVHDDGSIHSYVISDLDADPERFNERLSKLGLLRDALTRAEPVEIEHSGGEAGRIIERVSRISRDDLRPPGALALVTGLVLDVMVHVENRTGPDGERPDSARVTLLGTDLSVVQLVLNLQTPERLVADHQLQMIREAQQAGDLVRLLVEGEGADAPDSTVTGKQGGRILAVAVDHNADAFGDERAEEISGFVESLSLIALKPGDATGNFAHVRFTTAPDFSGSGGSVGLAPFTPVLWNLLVPRYSLTYDLFEAGLRDNLRMRVSLVSLAPREDEEEIEEREADEEREAMVEAGRIAARMARVRDADGAPQNLAITLAAELLAHLASASRPVWITISRATLDHGPEHYPCVTGTPTSDLQPRTLRDLRLPYPAAWEGLGCFNPGIYRFQFKLETDFTLFVDGEELCLHEASGEEGVYMAHACLGGEHEIRVELAAWTCDHEFVMDVYQLR